MRQHINVTVVLKVQPCEQSTSIQEELFGRTAEQNREVQKFKKIPQGYDLGTTENHRRCVVIRRVEKANSAGQI